MSSCICFHIMRLMLSPLATSNANVKSEPEDDRAARTVQDLGKCSNPDVGIADRERHVLSALLAQRLVNGVGAEKNGSAVLGFRGPQSCRICLRRSRRLGFRFRPFVSLLQTRTVQPQIGLPRNLTSFTRPTVPSPFRIGYSPSVP
jgi:hypothetical protein